MHGLEAGKDLADAMSPGSVLPDHALVGRPVAAGMLSGTARPTNWT